MPQSDPYIAKLRRYSTARRRVVERFRVAKTCTDEWMARVMAKKSPGKKTPTPPKKPGVTSFDYDTGVAQRIGEILKRYERRRAA